MPVGAATVYGLVAPATSVYGPAGLAADCSLPVYVIDTPVPARAMAISGVAPPWVSFTTELSAPLPGTPATTRKRALKSAAVEAKKLHVARGIGGKAYFILGGTLDAVEAADEASRRVIPAERLAGGEVIARLSPDVTLAML